MVVRPFVSSAKHCERKMAGANRQSPPPGQGFEHALVAVLEVDLDREVKDALVGLFAAALHDGRHGPLSYAAHGAKPKADGPFGVDGKLEFGLVDVRARAPGSPCAGIPP